MPAKKRGSRPRPMARPAADRGPPVSPPTAPARARTPRSDLVLRLSHGLSPTPSPSLLDVLLSLLPRKARVERCEIRENRSRGDESGQTRVVRDERVVRQNMSQVCHII